MSAWVLIASLAVAGAASRPAMADDPRPPVQIFALYDFVPYVPSIRHGFICLHRQRGPAVLRTGDFVF